MSTLRLASWIDGEWRPGPEELRDTEPAHKDAVVAEVAGADATLAADAIEAAHHAFAAWRATPAPARGEVLRKAADLLEQRAADIGRDLAREEGKTLGEGVAEAKGAVGQLRYAAGQTLEPDGEMYPSHSRTTALLYARREPLGVVVAITPWNFPISIPAWKLAPALAYGNTVVWKPAEITPLTAVHLLQALTDAGLPSGVLNLLLGRSSAVGQTLVEHPHVEAISFTGSNDAGRSVQTRAAAKGKKVQLEMGGKNPAVVLVDADLEYAAEQVARGAFLSAGQKCTATSRVIVDERVADDLARRLVARANSWRVGDPLDVASKVGPVASGAQFDTVAGYLERAQADGLKVLAGGGPGTGELESGYYIQPTVLSEVDRQHPVAREEIFGPVTALLPVNGYDEAVELANDTPYGLTASVFTNDLSRALRFAEDVRYGVVKVNQATTGNELQVPFGGMKESSSGSREMGKTSRDFFTQWKTVYIDLAAS